MFILIYAPEVRGPKAAPGWTDGRLYRPERPGAVRSFAAFAQQTCVRDCAAVSNERSRGRGGQGWTATAKDRATGEIKVIKSVACDNIKAGNLALQEAKFLQSLDHPAIVKYNDVFLHKEKSRQELLVCTVMEYCAHGDLAKRFRFTPSSLAPILFRTAT